MTFTDQVHIEQTMADYTDPCQYRGDQKEGAQIRRSSTVPRGNSGQFLEISLSRKIEMTNTEKFELKR